MQGYIVAMKPTGGDWKVVNVDPVREPKMVVQDLKELQEYQFAVKAINQAGPGAPSTASRPVVAAGWSADNSKVLRLTDNVYLSRICNICLKIQFV